MKQALEILSEMSAAAAALLWLTSARIRLRDPIARRGLGSAWTIQKRCCDWFTSKADGVHGRRSLQQLPLSWPWQTGCFPAVE